MTVKERSITAAAASNNGKNAKRRNEDGKRSGRLCPGHVLEMGKRAKTSEEEEGKTETRREEGQQTATTRKTLLGLCNSLVTYVCVSEYYSM